MEKDTTITFEDKTYSCKLISKDGQVLNVELSEDLFLKFNGSINLKDIYSQIHAFDEYTMEEVFSVMKDLSEEKFNLIKESDKFKLDIKIPVMKKEKHLIIDLNPIIESTDDIIQRLLKLEKNQEERIKALEIEINELKSILVNKIPVSENDEVNNKDEIKENKNIPEQQIKSENKSKEVDISLLKYEKEINGIKGSTLLVLNDGRISVGIEKNGGIRIYEPNNFYEMINIKSYGPMQTQLKNGLLLVEGFRGCAVLELLKNDFKKKFEIETGVSIFYFEELGSNYVAVSKEFSNNIYLYHINNDYEKYNEENSIYIFDDRYCKFILNINDEEMFYIATTKSYSAIKKAVFYKYKSRYTETTINIYADLENKPIAKITNDLIAVADSTKISLISTKERKVIKLIDIAKNIFCLYYLRDSYFRYLIVSDIDDNDEKNLLEQYKIDEYYYSVKLSREKNDMKIDSFIKTIGGFSNGHLFLLTYSGTIKILSQDEI